MPRFAHELLDQTTLKPEAIGGSVKGRIAQLLMMVAFGRNVEAALDWTARWASLLSQAGGGVDEFRRFCLYLMTTQDLEVVETFQEALRRHGVERGDEIMTYAQELLAEGEQRGKVEVVEGLLRVGVAWEVIEAATGLAETSFQEIKARLPGSDS